MLKEETYKKGIITSTGLNIAGKAVFFLNTLLIAFYFGTTISTDLYFYLFATITLLAGLVNGMDLGVILPEGMHIQVDEGRDKATAFYNFFGYCYLGLGILTGIVIYFFAVPVFQVISPFSKETLEQHGLLIALCSWLPVLIIMSSYFSSVLTTMRFFTVPLLATGIAQLCSFASILVFHEKLGVASALIGMVAGYFLNIVLLILFMKTKLRWNFRLVNASLHRRIRRNLVSVQLGNIATFAYNYGIIVLLSGLATGLYTAYNYGMQVVNVPNNFLVSQAAAIAGIKFNELAARNRHTEMNRIFQQSMGFLMFILIPVCMLTWLYADEVAALLYQRGTFTKEAAESVSYFIRYFIFLLPCLAINTFLSRLLNAVKKVKQSFYFQIGFNLVIFCSLIFCTRIFGLNGFTWATLVVYYVYFIFVCSYLMNSLMPYIDYASFLSMMVRIILLNLPLLILAVFAFDYLVYFLPLIYGAMVLLLNRSFKLVPLPGVDILSWKKNV